MDTPNAKSNVKANNLSLSDAQESGLGFSSYQKSVDMKI